MKNPITVGVVGCGYWGPNLIRNFRAVPGCRLKTICDVSEDRLRHLKGLYAEVHCETNFERMVADPEIDAISVATSVKHHFPMARAALAAGKHVLVEKPLAASIQQCEELIALAREKSRVLMVGHTFLFSPAVRKIKSIVERREIGEIRYISARRLNLGLFQTDINVAWDLAPHDLSIILYLMNELPLTVSCRGAANITPGIQDVTTMCLEFSGEKSASVQSSWLDPRKVREMTIVGSERMIVYDDLQTQEKIKIFDMHVKRPPHYDTFAEFHYAYHYGDIYSPYIKQEEPLRAECEHFVDCIRNGRKPITGGTEGLDVVTILECSSSSLRQNGAPVTLAGAGRRLSTSKGSNAPIVLPAGSTP